MKIELDELEALAIGAVQGPWLATSDFDGRDWIIALFGTDGSGCGWSVTTDRLHASDHNGGDSADDAKFVAAANPATVLALVRAVRAAMEARDVLADTMGYALDRREWKYGKEWTEAATAFDAALAPFRKEASDG